MTKLKIGQKIRNLEKLKIWQKIGKLTNSKNWQNWNWTKIEKLKKNYEYRKKDSKIGQNSKLKRKIIIRKNLKSLKNTRKKHYEHLVLIIILNELTSAAH